MPEKRRPRRHGQSDRERRRLRYQCVNADGEPLEVVDRDADGDRSNHSVVDAIARHHRCPGLRKAGRRCCIRHGVGNSPEFPQRRVILLERARRDKGPTGNLNRVRATMTAVSAEDLGVEHSAERFNRLDILNVESRLRCSLRKIESDAVELDPLRVGRKRFVGGVGGTPTSPAPRHVAAAQAVAVVPTSSVRTSVEGFGWFGLPPGAARAMVMARRALLDAPAGSAPERLRWQTSSAKRRRSSVHRSLP